MLKGVTPGILVQCISGRLPDDRKRDVDQERGLRTGLMVVFAGVVALIAIGYRSFPGSSA